MKRTVLKATVFLFVCLLASANHSKADLLVATGTSVVKYNDLGTEGVLFIDYPATGLFYDSTNEKLYFSTIDGRIGRADRDGKNVSILFSNGGNEIPDLVVDLTNNKIIWTSPVDAAIIKGNLDGTGSPSALYSGYSSVYGLYIEPVTNTLYFSAEGSIYSAAANGSTSMPASLVADPDSPLSPSYITYHAGRLYWTTFSSGKLNRVFIDGAGRETIVSGHVGIEGLGYDPSSKTITFAGYPSHSTGLYRVMSNGEQKSLIKDSVKGYDIIPGYEVIDSPERPVRSATQTDNTVFYSILNGGQSESHIYRVSPEGTATKILTQSIVVLSMDYSYSTDKLYMGTADGSIYTVNADGSGFELFSPYGVSYSGSSIEGMTIDDDSGAFLISSTDSASVYRLSLTDPANITLRDVRTGIRGISAKYVSLYGDAVVAWGEPNNVAYNKLAQGSGGVQSVAYSGTAKGIAVGPVAVSDFDELPFSLIVSNTNKQFTVTDRMLPGGVSSKTVTRDGFIDEVASYSTVSKGVYRTTYLVAEEQKILMFTPETLGLNKIATFVQHNDDTLGRISGLCTGRVNNLSGIPKTGDGEKGGKNVSGKVGGVNNGASAAGVFPAETNTVLVYLKPKSATGSSSLIDTQVTTTDGGGNYTFRDVPDGDYTVTFARSDRYFSVPSFDITISDNEAEIPLSFAIVNEAPAGCGWTEKLSALSNANSKAASLYAYALKQADIVRTAAAKLTGASRTRLETLVTTSLASFATHYSAALDGSVAVPSVVLSCPASAGCGDTSYKSSVASYSNNLKKLSKAVSTFVGKAQKQLGKKKNLKAGGVLAKLAKLVASIEKAKATLPSKSASCPS